MSNRPLTEPRTELRALARSKHPGAQPINLGLTEPTEPQLSYAASQLGRIAEKGNGSQLSCLTYSIPPSSVTQFVSDHSNAQTVSFAVKSRELSRLSYARCARGVGS
jgi:hypothetical protein